MVRSDTAKLSDIEELGRIVEAKLGQVDFVFINAGVSELQPFDQVTEASYDRQFDVNTKGAFFTAQRLAPLRETALVAIAGEMETEASGPGPNAK